MAPTPIGVAARVKGFVTAERDDYIAVLLTLRLRDFVAARFVTAERDDHSSHHAPS